MRGDNKLHQTLLRFHLATTNCHGRGIPSLRVDICWDTFLLTVAYPNSGALLNADLAFPSRIYKGGIHTVEVLTIHLYLSSASCQMYLHHGLFAKISIRTTHLTYKVGFPNITMGETSYKFTSRLALAHHDYRVLALQLASDSNGKRLLWRLSTEKLATKLLALQPAIALLHPCTSVRA